MKKVLLIGYGNPGRLDDGLGPAIAKKIEAKKLPNVTVDSDYQLVVEDATVVAQHDIVIFADAATDAIGSYYFKPIEPAREMSFSTHSVKPGQLVTLAEKLFGSKAKCYILGVKGYDFNEFGQKLSKKAKENLEIAVEFVTAAITESKFETVE